MAKVAGADGCRKGWIVVVHDLDHGTTGARILANAEEIAALAVTVEVLAVDIPIGLTDAGPRECDREARRLLGVLVQRFLYFPPSQ